MPVAGFIPPAHWTEIAGLLHDSQTATLSSAGLATLIFTPNSGNQRWVLSNVLVSTNQAATATVVPYATLALNTTAFSTMSPGNARGTSWAGNNDQFRGYLDVGPCEFCSLLFYPPPGATAGQIAALAGVTATVVISGTRYTRR